MQQDNSEQRDRLTIWGMGQWVAPSSLNIGDTFHTSMGSAFGKVVGKSPTNDAPLVEWAEAGNGATYLTDTRTVITGYSYIDGITEEVTPVLVFRTAQPQTEAWDTTHKKSLRTLRTNCAY